MKKATSLYLGIGFILIAITCIIFFIPKMGTEIADLEYAKLAIILVSEIVLILNLIIMANGKPLFSTFTTTSLTMFWFVVNFIITIIMASMQTLLMWTSVLFLIYIALMLILGFIGGVIAEDEAKIETKRANKKK